MWKAIASLISAGTLALTLGRMGIMHRWEGIDLVLSTRHEPDVDKLFDGVEF